MALKEAVALQAAAAARQAGPVALGSREDHRAARREALDRRVSRVRAAVQAVRQDEWEEAAISRTCWSECPPSPLLTSRRVM